MLKDKDKMLIKPEETTAAAAAIERINRLMGINVYLCPYCKKERMVPVAIIPRIRSPTFGIDPVLKMMML